MSYSRHASQKRVLFRFPYVGMQTPHDSSNVEHLIVVSDDGVVSSEVGHYW